LSAVLPVDAFVVSAVPPVGAVDVAFDWFVADDDGVVVLFGSFFSLALLIVFFVEAELDTNCALVT
jgi:hypothetical protein